MSIQKYSEGETPPAQVPGRTPSPSPLSIPLDTMALSSSGPQIKQGEEFLLKFLQYFSRDSVDTLKDAKQFTLGKKQILDHILLQVSGLCHEYGFFPEYKSGTLHSLDHLASCVEKIEIENIRIVCKAQILQLTQGLVQQEQGFLKRLGDLENAAKTWQRAIKVYEATGLHDASEEKESTKNENSRKSHIISAFSALMQHCYLNNLIRELPLPETLFSKEMMATLLKCITEEMIEMQTNCPPSKENHITQLGETLTAIIQGFDDYNKLPRLNATHTPSSIQSSSANITKSLSQITRAATLKTSVPPLQENKKKPPLPDYSRLLIALGLPATESKKTPAPKIPRIKKTLPQITSDSLVAATAQNGATDSTDTSTSMSRKK